VFTVDESRSPVLVTTWRAPHSADVMREFLAWQLRTITQARQRGHRVGYVHDAVDAGLLDASARRVVAEWRAANPAVDEVMVGNWVVSRNRLAAGTIIALGWFFPEARKVQLVPTLDEALRRAAAALDVAGPPPSGPASTSVGHHTR
jgi:hypothetical protein